MFEVAGIDFHQAGLELALMLRDILPFLHRQVHRVVYSVRGNPSQFLLLRKSFVAKDFPALIELALVLVGPFFCHLVRAMNRTRGKIDQEGLVRVKGAREAYPVNGFLSQILGQVIIGVMRRLDRIGVLEQAGFIL